MTELTRRQGEILSFIEEYIERCGYPPTIRELREAFGLRSNRGVIDHLRALERKGYIERGRKSSRAIVLTRRAAGRAMDAGERSILYPIAGGIAAGPPAMPIEDVTETILLDERLFGSRGDFLLEVKGESMIGDHIAAGDLVAVRRTGRASSGDLVVVLVDGEATLKRFVERDGRVLLEPSNPAYGPIVLDGSDGRCCRLIGRVIGVIRRRP